MAEAGSVHKPKKSVALSGVLAGNTALCTVGRTGNDLHYRGYDILDIADRCEFEEIAYLLIHGKLPTQTELDGYKLKLSRLRGLPAMVKNVLEQLPAATHPMDVMRTGVDARLRAAREGGSQSRGRSRYRGSAHRESRLDAHVLVPLQHFGQTDRCRDRRRFDRRTLLASASRSAPVRPVGQRDACLAHS